LIAQLAFTALHMIAKEAKGFIMIKSNAQQVLLVHSLAERV
jgi:hypothetical protein